MRVIAGFMFVLFFSAACTSAFAAPRIDLTPEESRWLAEHPVVRFTAEAGLPPLEDIQGGRYTGLFSDYLEVVAARSGLRFQLVPAHDWDHAQQLFLNGKVDMFANAAPDRVSAAAGEALVYSRPYYASPFVIIAPAHAPMVFQREELRGKKIAYRSRGANEFAFSSLFPGATGIVFGDPDSVMQAVADGRADLMVGTEAIYPPILRNHYVGVLGVAGMLDAPPYQARFAVRHDDPELLSIINKALGTLTAEETDRIYDRGLSLANYGEPSLQAIVRYRTLELTILLVMLALLASAMAWALRATRNARRSEAAKATFLATMSHEIRTPVNAMVGAMELLGRGSLEHSQQEMVDVASLAAEALTDLLDNVLDLSKMDASRLELERVPTDVVQLLQHAASVAELGARKKGLEVRVEIRGLNQALIVDPTRLRQVISNLLGNAVKFTDSGEVKLSAVFHLPLGADVGTLTIAVQDTGPGIAEAQQTKLFQAYSQADQSTTRRYGGTGLGLTICRELVTLMRGDIVLTSQPGEGTRVEFTIPAMQGSRMPLAQVVAKVPPDQPELSPIATMVLVAEDHEINGRLICDQLAALGVLTRLVINGNEAVKAAFQGNLDMILMDCHMPELDGYDAARAIRKAAMHAPHLPIIAISAATDATHLLRCEESGMDGVLRKPVKTSDLIGMLELWGLDYVKPLVTKNLTGLTDIGASEMENSLKVDVLAMVGAWLQGDAPTIEHHAHRLRGAAAMCNLPVLADICSQLEGIASNQIVPDVSLIAAVLGEVFDAKTLSR